MAVSFDNLLALNGDTRTAFARSTVPPPPSFVAHAKQNYCKIYGFDLATFEKQVDVNNKVFPEYLDKEWAQCSSTWKATGAQENALQTKPKKVEPKKAEPKKADGLKKRDPKVTVEKPAKVEPLTTVEDLENCITGNILSMIRNKVTRPAVLIFAASLGVEAEKARSQLRLTDDIMQALRRGNFQEPDSDCLEYMYDVAEQMKSSKPIKPDAKPATKPNAKPTTKPDADATKPDAKPDKPISPTKSPSKKPPLPPVEAGVEPLETEEAPKAVIVTEAIKMCKRKARENEKELAAGKKRRADAAQDMAQQHMAQRLADAVQDEVQRRLTIADAAQGEDEDETEGEDWPEAERAEAEKAHNVRAWLAARRLRRTRFATSSTNQQSAASLPPSAGQ